MARIFDLKITSVAVECSLGYDVYYDIVNPNNFATNVATGNLATGIPLFLFQRPKGFRVSVPDLATSVIIYDPCCGISQEFIINGDDPCFIGDKTEFEATECLKLDTVINACYVSYLNYDNQIETLKWAIENGCPVDEVLFSCLPSYGLNYRRNQVNIVEI
jgi:hypothetical protein